MSNNTEWLKDTVIAHRGIHDNETVAENSKSAIIKAINEGVAVELDVNFTKDNTPIVFHDETLSRMTNIDGYVNLVTYEEIKEEKLLKSDDHILTVKEVLEIVEGKTPILFSISGNLPITLCKFFYDVVKDYTGEIAVMSSNPYTLEWFKLNAPRIKRGQRAGAYKHEKPSFGKRGQLRKLKLNHVSEPNFIVYRIEDAKKRYFKKTNKEGLPLILWTARTNKDNLKAEQLCANVIKEVK